MKLERLPEYFITTLVLLIGLAVAIYVGVRLGAGNMRPVVFAVGAICFLAIGAALGKNVWLLIPLSLYGAPKILELPISMGQAGAITAFLWWVIFVAFKQVKMKNRWGVLDVIMVVNLAYLVALYIRRPIGGLIFASDIVGIAPYFYILFGLMSYWVLARVNLTEVWARRMPWLIVLGTLPALVASLALKVSPSVSPVTLFIFGIGDQLSEVQDAVEVSQKTREAFLGGPANALLMAVFAYYPMKKLLNPLYVKQAAIVAVGLIMLLLTGFRNSIGALGINFILIAWYRESLGRLFRVTLLALPVVALILAGHGRLYTFPFAIQRTLSFLPAKWDDAPVDDAKGSSQWRYEMWDMMFEDTRYLKDRWFGDGFGYSYEELLDHLAAARGSWVGNQELFIFTGDVHSGPYSAIRYAGYVGLALFMVFIIAVAIKAHRVIRRAKGTPYEFPALVLGVPMVFAPVFFVFIFGAYNNAVAETIVNLGFLKLLENGVNAYRLRQKNALAEASETDGSGEAPETKPAPLPLPA